MQCFMLLSLLRGVHQMLHSRMQVQEKKEKMKNEEVHLFSAGHGQLEGAQPLFQLGHDHAVNDGIVQNRQIFQLGVHTYAGTM